MANNGGFQSPGCYSQLLGSQSKPDPENPLLNSTLDSKTAPVSWEEKFRVGLQTGKKMAAKKSKSSVNQHAKVGRKERLGERINVLQQLVSPFGKTDAASVLHEASGYIKFLQDQVQVLCSPYLQRIPKRDETVGNQEEDLRNSGLCLVPVEIGRRVAAEPNGADFWSSSSVG